jgi:hypothetical protein
VCEFENSIGLSSGENRSVKTPCISCIVLEIDVKKGTGSLSVAGNVHPCSLFFVFLSSISIPRISHRVPVRVILDLFPTISILKKYFKICQSWVLFCRCVNIKKTQW